MQFRAEEEPCKTRNTKKKRPSRDPRGIENLKEWIVARKEVHV